MRQGTATHRKRFRFGIQRRIVLWLLVLGVVPVLVTSMLGHWVMTRAATFVAAQRLMDLSENLASGLDNELRTIVGSAARLGTRTPEVRSAVERRNAGTTGPDAALSARLRRFAGRDPVLYAAITVTDSMGRIVGTTQATGHQSYRDSDWWQGAFGAGRGSVCLDRIRHDDGSHVVNIANPVMDSTLTSAIGVVRILADLSDLVEQVNGTRVGRTGFSTLVSSGGEASPRTYEADDFGPGGSTQPLFAGIPVWLQDRSPATGDDAVMALAPVKTSWRYAGSGSGWTVVTEQSKIEILAAARLFGRTAVFVFLVTAAVIIIVGVFLSDRITLPLRELRDGAGRIGSGELDLRLQLPTGDELEDLAADFNSMAERLQESYRGLEEKVCARTAELAREKDSLKGIVTSLGEGLMVVDPDHRIVMWNRTAEQMTGYEAGDVVGHRCSNVLRTATDQDEDICGTQCPVTAAFEERRMVSRHDLNTTIRASDGRTVYVSFTATPLFDESGQSRGCVVILRDMSPEREMDELKSSMISMVSHELRGPLTPIIGFARLLQNDDLPPEKRRQFTDLIIKEGRRLTSLVDDFLTLSRIEAGRFELNFGEVDIRKVVGDVLALNEAGLSRHELVNRVPGDFPVIRADRERVKRVLLNLVSNAIKYSPSGGTVTVSGRDLGDSVEVSVTDEGIGIQEQDLPKLFHRFQRINRMDASKAPGIGLGLSICRSIVEEHGGTIRAESGHGKGSTFTFTLPVNGRGAHV